MVSAMEPVRINRSVLEQLAIDAMLLADEAESYFGGEEDPACATLPVELQVEFACEAFRTTALLKQLVDRLSRPELVGASPPLAEPGAPDSLELQKLPPRARAIVAATRALHARVRDLEFQRLAAAASPLPSPARQLQAHLVASLQS